jgi:hypothetical protein
MINIEKRSKNRPNLQVGVKKITFLLRIFEKFVRYKIHIFQKSGVSIIHPLLFLLPLAEFIKTNKFLV